MGNDFSNSCDPVEFLIMNLDSMIDYESKTARFTDPKFMETMDRIKEEFYAQKAYVTILTSDADNVCLLHYDCNYPLVEVITPEVTEGVFLKFCPE